MNRLRNYAIGPWVVWLAVVPASALILLVIVLVAARSADVEFDRMQWWWLVFALPACVCLFGYGFHRRAQAIERFASSPLVDLLTPSFSPSKRAMKAGLFALAVLCVAAAIIGPKWGIDYDKREALGVDVMVVLDVSRSMLAGDLKPNRLQAAKRRIDRLIASRRNRIGLMAFAGQAALKCPLTLDYGFARDILGTIDPSSAPRAGTNIGKALEKAADHFTDQERNDSKAIVLITDGEDHEGFASEAAGRLYKERGIRTFTVGIGDSNRGERVPDASRGGRTFLKHDGQEVWSKLDAATLRKIATESGGKYAAIDQFEAIIHELDALEKRELSMSHQKRYRPQYQWFLGAAMLCLAAETFLTDRRRPVEGEPLRVWERQPS